MILVAAGLIYRDKHLLIAQRPAGKHGALQWEFPGGKVESDEDPRECLVREVREELGVEIHVGDVVETVFYRYPERSVLLLFYRCSWISGEPCAIECQAFDWADASSLSRYDFMKADLEFIRRIEEEAATKVATTNATKVTTTNGAATKVTTTNKGSD